MPSVSPVRRAGRIGLGLAAVLALAACAPGATPTPAPTTSPAPTAAPTAEPTAVPTAEPTPVPTAVPAASTTAAIGALAPSPSVDRRATGVLGSRICVVNGAGAWMDAAATSNEVVDLRNPGSAGVVESVRIPSGGSWCTHGYNDCTLAGGDLLQDVCGFITLPDGRSVAYRAFNPWMTEPYLRVADEAGNQVEQRWSVGERASLVTGGYTVTGERLGDAPSDKLFQLTITRS